MKVTLKKDHTHGDVAHKAGAEIEVSKPDALWLQAHGVIDEPGLRTAAEAKGADNVTPIKS